MLDAGPSPQLLLHNGATFAIITFPALSIRISMQQGGMGSLIGVTVC